MILLPALSIQDQSCPKPSKGKGAAAGFSPLIVADCRVFREARLLP